MMTERVGAWMTPLQLRQRNRELKKLGKRICSQHQGAALPMTFEYFYYADGHKTRFRGECRKCTSARVNEYMKLRLKVDAEYAVLHRARKRDWQRRNRHKHLNYYYQVEKPRASRQHFARVLGVAS